jgi:limonene-1,2-epoxide hydrolase
MVRRFLLMVVIGLTASVLVGCGGDRSSDEIQVVKDFYAAVNAKDMETAMKYVAERAVFINPTGTYRGAKAVRDFLEQHEDVTYEHTNFRAQDGRVVYDFTVTNYIQVVAEGTDGLTIVEDGKIVFDGTEGTEPEH